MNKNVKLSSVAGVILYVLAAVFSVSLITVLFDFGVMNPARGTFIYRMGKLFTGVYGFCSVLIPLFLLVSAFECFTSRWHTRNGVMLLGSVIPFFTLDAIEHISRMVISGNEGDVLVMKLGATLVTGAIIIAVEYLVLSMIGDVVEEVGKAPEEKALSAEKIDGAVEDKDLEFKQAVAEDAKSISLLNNKLSALKKIVEEQKLQRIEDKIAAEEARKNHEEQAKEGLVEAQTQEELEEKLQEKPEEAPVEDNPFAHVFDEQDKAEAEKDIAAEDEAEAFAEGEEAAPVAEENAAEAVTEGVAFEEGVLAPTEEEFFAEDFDEPGYTDIPVSSDAFDEEVELPDLTDEFEVEGDESADAGFEADDYSSALNAPSPFDDYDFPEEGEILDPSEIDFDVIGEGIEPALDSAEEEVPSEAFQVSDKEFESADTFGDATFSSEIDGDMEEGDLSDFVEDRNNSFDHIFAEMDFDAAKNPVESSAESFEDDFDSIFDDNELTQGIPQELEQDYSVKDDINLIDPTAAPVVDSNGVPFGPAVPFDIEDTSFDEVAKAKKTAKPLSFAEKAVFLQESEEGETATVENPPAAEEKPSVSKKTAVDSNGVPVVQEKKKPKLRIANYKVPVDGILQTYENGEYWIIDDLTKQKAADLKQTLSEFNIDVEITGIRKGPVVTMFEVLPAPGVNVNKIRSLQDNIALRLAATSVRIVSPIPGKSAVGIEIPNASRAIVSFREIMEQKNPAFDKMNIPVILGKDISGDPQIIDLAKTPHLLIAGSTGSGKSVCVNSLILSILYKRSPQQVKLILVDPKVVELKLYNDIPHLLTPVITEPKKALQSLQYCICEMERRYALLDNMGVRDINSYNRRIEERNLMQEKLPYIVVIIDEFADLMATTGKELESNVARLAAMSRAVGIHLVLATQRPSVNVITGLIKANIPSRVAFMVASRTDSNIIIDQIGAEKLLGKGDMLYASATDPFPVRIQGTLVSDDEVEKVVEYVKQYGEPDYIDDEIFVEDEDEGSGNPGLFSDGADPLYDQALEIVVQSGKASASYLQRRLKIGYNRAARLVEEMEERGIVGPQNGSKPREVIYAP